MLALPAAKLGQESRKIMLRSEQGMTAVYCLEEWWLQTVHAALAKGRAWTSDLQPCLRCAGWLPAARRRPAQVFTLLCILWIPRMAEPVTRLCTLNSCGYHSAICACQADHPLEAACMPADVASLATRP